MSENMLRNESHFLMPTPAGAYYSVSDTERNPARRFLQALLVHDSGVQMDIDNLKREMQLERDEDAFALLGHIQKLGWVEGFEEPPTPPVGQLENLLPDILTQLSASGKALLADDQGFYISSSGFPHETAEELSGLSASLATLHGRYSGVLKNNLGQGISAWGLVDATGNSQLGFWPMFIGDHRFALVVGGLPQMNRPALVSLVWALMMRYGVQLPESIE